MKPETFTQKYESLANVLWSEIAISRCAIEDSPKECGEEKISHAIKGIWDTGATNSVVSKRIVKMLGLPIINKVIVRHVNGEYEARICLVNFTLPCGAAIQNLLVTEGDLGGDFDVLVGMDVIGRGDFAVSNFNGKTAFCFRIPSIADADLKTK